MNFFKQLFSKFIKKDKTNHVIDLDSLQKKNFNDVYKEDDVKKLNMGHYVKPEAFKGFNHTVEEGQRMAKKGHYAEIPDPDLEFKK